MSDQERLIWVLGAWAVLVVLFFLLGLALAESRKRKNREVQEKFEQAQRRKWEGHRREEPFKRRYHRRDPWLQKLGYFKRWAKGKCGAPKVE
jgi:hypothetical protein